MKCSRMAMITLLLFLLNGCSMAEFNQVIAGLNAFMAGFTDGYTQGYNQPMAGYNQSLMNQINQNNANLSNYNRQSGNLTISPLGNSNNYPASNSANNSRNTYDRYMEGHPSYNPNYYSPNYNESRSTPNYDPNYYDRTRTYNYNY